MARRSAPKSTSQPSKVGVVKRVRAVKKQAASASNSAASTPQKAKLTRQESKMERGFQEWSAKDEKAQIDAIFANAPPHGASDPQTMWRAWLKKGSPQEKYMRHMWANAPRCMKSRGVPADAQTRKLIQEAYGPLSTVWELHASRGDVPLEVWRSADGQGLSIGAVDPSTAAFAFDARRDGYDGEFGHLGKATPFKGRKVKCTSCKAEHWLLALAFQYSGGNEELDEPALIDRRQDFFGWFAVVGVCSACKTPVIIADVECS